MHATVGITTRLQQALAHHRRGELHEAESLYRAIIADVPAHFDALHLLGVLQHQRGEEEAAEQLIRRAIAINPADAAAWSNLGLCQRKRNRPEDALESFARALVLAPDHLQALNNRGNVLRDLGRHQEALASYDRALALRSDYAEALKNRAATLLDMGHHEAALEAYDRALAARDDAEAHYGRGNALMLLRRPDEALLCYDRALSLNAGYFEACNHRGRALLELKRPAEALAAFERALALRPASVEALDNCGSALLDLGRAEEALTFIDRALLLDPDCADALTNRSGVLLELNRPDQAANSLARLLEVAPDYALAKGRLLHAKMLCCDWEGQAPLAASVTEDVRAGKFSAEPFGYQAVADSVSDLEKCAALYATLRFPQAPAVLWKRERYKNAKIRVGYVSGEFRHQATSMLMAELFERHDRSRFELHAFDNGGSDGSEIRMRIDKAFDKVVAIAHMSDLETATLIRSMQVEILVNLNGYFGLLRQGVFAQRPCPVQVNYLGFPGTLGADYIDYIVADSCVIPPEHEGAYHERVVRLPDSYQVNDSTRKIAATPPSRAEAGLPATGFVFCCFNNNYKLTPAVFDVWMRLLGRVEGSVLWLLGGNAVAARNLRREAQRRGIGPERLVFAEHAPLDVHLARHQLADLFLDTLPYNAHTTASDALWAGLPVLTCLGSTFPGRVAASLLAAVGLPELVTHSLAHYEATALKLVTIPSQLASFRAMLARTRTTAPLFDTDRFRRHIEAAYTTMWERYQRGESPAAFSVHPLPGMNNQHEH